MNNNYKNNAFFSTVVDPFTHAPVRIPDSDSQQSTLKSVTTAVSFNYPTTPTQSPLPGGDPANIKAGAPILFVVPFKAPRRTIKIYAFDLANSTTASNRFNWLQDLYQDEDLSAFYRLLRVVSAGITVQSATLSGQAFTVSGTVNAVSFQDLPPIDQLTHANLPSWKRDNSNVVVSVPASTTVVGTAAIDSRHDYFVPEANDQSSATLARQLSRGDILFQSTPLGAVVVNPGEDTTVNGAAMSLNGNPIEPWGHQKIVAQGQVDIVGTPPGAPGGITSPSVELTLLCFGFQANPQDFTQETVLLASKTVTPTISLATGIPQVDQYCWGIEMEFDSDAPMAFWQLAVEAGAGNSVPINVTCSGYWENDSYARDGASVGGSLISISGLTPGQQVAVAAKTNYEAVPTSSLARNLPTSYQYEYNPVAIEAAQLALSSPEYSCYKQIYTADEYARMLGTLDRDAEMGRIVGHAATLGGMLSKMWTNLVRPTLAAVAAPAGMAFGSALSSVTGLPTAPLFGALGAAAGQALMNGGPKGYASSVGSTPNKTIAQQAEALKKLTAVAAGTSPVEPVAYDEEANRISSEALRAAHLAVAYGYDPEAGRVNDRRHHAPICAKCYGPMECPNLYKKEGAGAHVCPPSDPCCSCLVFVQDFIPGEGAPAVHQPLSPRSRIRKAEAICAEAPDPEMAKMLLEMVRSLEEKGLIVGYASTLGNPSQSLHEALSKLKVGAQAQPFAPAKSMDFGLIGAYRKKDPAYQIKASYLGGALTRSQFVEGVKQHHGGEFVSHQWFPCIKETPGGLVTQMHSVALTEKQVTSVTAAGEMTRHPQYNDVSGPGLTLKVDAALGEPAPAQAVLNILRSQGFMGTMFLTTSWPGVIVGSSWLAAAMQAARMQPGMFAWTGGETPVTSIAEKVTCALDSAMQLFVINSEPREFSAILDVLEKADDSMVFVIDPANPQLRPSRIIFSDSLPIWLTSVLALRDLSGKGGQTALVNQDLVNESRAIEARKQEKRKQPVVEIKYVEKGGVEKTLRLDLSKLDIEEWKEEHEAAISALEATGQNFARLKHLQTSETWESLGKLMGSILTKEASMVAPKSAPKKKKKPAGAAPKSRGTGSKATELLRQYQASLKNPAPRPAPGEESSDEAES